MKTALLTLLTTLLAIAAGMQTVELERAESKLRDWAALARYREENARLGAPAAGERRVVFIGASTIDLWGRKRGQFFPGKPYVNRGISGQTTPQMLVRMRPDVIALRPAVVVMMGGGNDIAGNTGPVSLEDIEANLMSMAELARMNGIRVVLTSVPPCCNGKTRWLERRPVERVRALNAWIKEYAAKAGHVYLDWFTPLADTDGLLKEELSWDCLHPNEAGYEIMAPLAERAIAEALR